MPSLSLGAVSTEEGKAELIKAFFSHVTWPDEDQISYFSIGFYGRDVALRRALSRSLGDFSVRGKSFRISDVSSFSSAADKHLLLVAPSKQNMLPRLVRSIRQTQTLIVTDGVLDKRDVMINFTHPEPDRLSFEINRSNVIYEGLQLSKDILLFGGTELDVATIYKETEAELERIAQTVEAQRLALAQQDTQIVQQQQQIGSQRQMLESQRASIDKQKREMAAQREEIEQQRELIGQQSLHIAEREQELDRLERSLGQIRDALSESKSELGRKEASMDEYSAQIRRNLDLLRQSSIELARQEALIKEKNTVLSKQLGVIQNQRFILITAAIAIAVFVLMLLMIYRGYLSKQRINRQLERRTKELQQANEKLQQMSLAKSLFLSTMSHEIRTPLNGVLGMVELLKDTALDKQQRRYLDLVHTSGEMLLSVINDVLDYSKIEAGKMQVENAEFDLEKMVYGCAAIFSLRSATDPLFVVDMDPLLPNYIRGDSLRIRQILLNFLSNAFKFTEHGRILLCVEPCPQEQQFYRICVEDTGIGLSEEQCSNIFDAFTQADITTSRSYGGTGLGLAISAHLAQLMGGEIIVDSALGKGSRFCLRLPLQPVESAAAAAGSALRDKRLLFVGVKTEQHNALLRHLPTWGMQLLYAESGEQAAALLARGLPDWLMCAEMVDDRPGLQWIAEIKQQYPALSTILLRSPAGPLAEALLRSSGVGAVLELPVAPGSLRRLLETQRNGDSGVAQMLSNNVSAQKQYAGLNVLVAEDNAVNQMVIKGLLGRLGIKPVVAANGVAAVNCFIEQNAGRNAGGGFDLILMDCEMPELDGLGAARQIRQLEQQRGWRAVPIVALTAHVMDEHRKKVLSAGMDAHLAKPLKPESLQDILRRYCV